MKNSSILKLISKFLIAVPIIFALGLNVLYPAPKVEAQACANVWQQGMFCGFNVGWSNSASCVGTRMWHGYCPSGFTYVRANLWNSGRHHAWSVCVKD